MTIKQVIDQDLKTAMLSGDKPLVEVLRGIKSAILNVEISGGNREQGLSDVDIIAVLQKESKKRGDAIELYEKANQKERAEAEQYERQIIEKYLPEQMSDEEVRLLIDAEIKSLNSPFTRQQMGQVIGAIKAKTAGGVDGATIARLVQEKL